MADIHPIATDNYGNCVYIRSRGDHLFELD